MRKVLNLYHYKERKKKKQITGFSAVSMTGDFLQMQLIYEGKASRCLLKDVEFPKELDVTFTPNHWSNDEKSKQLLNNVIFPYLKKKKKKKKHRL